MTGERHLGAADVLAPSPGEVVEVVAGEVLVFASEAASRRIGLTTVAAGGVVVGCGGFGEVQLVVTGLPGTVVRHRRAGAAESVDTALLENWVTALCSAAGAGHWPHRMLAATRAGAMVSPGEHIVAEHPIEWVSITGGSATLCSVPEAVLGPGDLPVALGRGAWLTAGMRCRVQVVPAPDDVDAWLASLDTLGCAVLAAVAGRRRRADAKIAARYEVQGASADADARAAVGLLTRSVGAGAPAAAGLTGLSSTAFDAAVVVAKASGLAAADDRVGRAAGEVAAGRAPVEAVAAAFDSRVRPVSLTADWWRREGVAMVVNVTGSRGSQPQAAAAVWRRGWMLVDPVAGTELAVTADVAATIDRRAVELLAVLPARPATLGDLGRLALGGTRRELAVVAAVTVLLAVLSFATPFLLGRVASLLVTAAGAGAYVGLFGALGLVVVAGVAWQSVRALALLRSRARATAVASGAVWDRTMRQPARWHADRRLGLRTGAVGAVNNASSAVADQTVASLLDVTVVVGSLAAVATTAPLMLVSLSVLVLVQLVVTVALLRMASRQAQRRVEATALATGRLLELLKGVTRLRVAGAESRAFHRWAQLQRHRLRADQALRRIAMAQGVVIAVWPVVALIVVVAITAVDDLGLGAFVTAQTAASIATMAVAAVAISANGALVGRQALRQAEPSLASIPDDGANGAPPGVLSGSIEVRDLVFGYSPELPPVLDQVSFSVAAGEHVAIVGPSGCGKTTLMRVLLGLEQPESGVIAVDGRDLAGLDRPAVRRQIGSVLQSSALVPGTIRDNVAMGRGATSAQIWEALDGAAVGEDVRALSMGIDTPVTDGAGTLSGGQRQRILIARALLGTPRVLVFDEATSSLDNVSQAAVIDTLERQRITRIVVAHRLSTIRHADRIIVMGAGQVVDQGTFDELTARPGPFAELAQRQQL